MPSASTNLSEVVQKTMTRLAVQAITTNNSSCVANANNSQSLTIGCLNGTNGVTIVQDITNKTTVDCVQQTSNDQTFSSDIQNQMSTLVDQVATANPGAINVSTNVSKQVQETVVDLSTKIDIDNFKTCVANAQNQQNINIGCVSDSTNLSVTQVIDNDILVDCMQTDMNIVAASSSVTNAMAATTTQKATSGFDFSAIAIIIIAVIGLLVSFVLLGPKLLSAIRGNKK